MHCDHYSDGDGHCLQEGQEQSPGEMGSRAGGCVMVRPRRLEAEGTHTGQSRKGLGTGASLTKSGSPEL